MFDLSVFVLSFSFQLFSLAPPAPHTTSLRIRDTTTRVTASRRHFRVFQHVYGKSPVFFAILHTLVRPKRNVGVLY